MFRLRRDASNVGALMCELAAQLHVSAQNFATALVPDPSARATSLEALRGSDFDAQNLAHAVLRGLAASFVTPFDRADVFRLTWALRRCSARIEAAGDCLDLLAGTDEVPVSVPSMINLVIRSTEMIADMVPRLEHPGEVSAAWVELTMVCKQAAQVHRRVVAEVAADNEPARMIRHLALAEDLRRIVDGVEGVSDAIATVVVRES